VSCGSTKDGTLENMEVVKRTASRAPILFEWQPFTYVQVSYDNTFCLTFFFSLEGLKKVEANLQGIIVYSRLPLEPTLHNPLLARRSVTSSQDGQSHITRLRFG
jgi:hypothetical protein